MRRITLLLMMAPFLLGCWSSSAVQEVEGTVPATGSVTFDGQPLVDGRITFVPTSAQPAREYTAEIRAGRFESRAPPRLLRVEIRAYEPGAGMEAADDETVGELRQLIPARYNDRSELSVELQTDARNELSFDLESGKR